MFAPDAGHHDGGRNEEESGNGGGGGVREVDVKEFLRGRNVEENPRSVGGRKGKPEAIGRRAGEDGVQEINGGSEPKKKNDEDVGESSGRAELFENERGEKMDAENEGEENEDGDDDGDAGLRGDGAHERENHEGRNEREETGERNDKKCGELADEDFGAGDAGAEDEAEGVVAAFVREELRAERRGAEDVDQGCDENEPIEESANFAGREIEIENENGEEEEDGCAGDDECGDITIPDCVLLTQGEPKFPKDERGDIQWGQ